MHPERRVRLSKFLSLILRHKPEQVGLTLDGQGRVAVDALLAALRANKWEDLRPEEIAEVARLDGRRFELEGGMIRARYGHSLVLEQPGLPVRPPEWLYCPVGEAELERVRGRGLQPEQRQHIHLCRTPQEADRLLERRSAAGVVIIVFARRAHDRGVPFYQASDHLYLTPHVPPDLLSLPTPAPVAHPG